MNDELLGGPFLGSEAAPLRLVTPEQLRGGPWRRLFRNVYVSYDVPLTQRMLVDAAALLLPPGAAISGATAAGLFGGVSPRVDEPIQITVPRDTPLRPRSGLAIRRALLPPTHIANVRGIPVTTVLRTAFDIARLRQPRSRSDLTEAVVALDALAHQRAFGRDELLSFAAAHPGWRGIRLVPEVVDLVDPGAESPPESRLRLTLIFGGLPRPVTQYVIRDRLGNFIARVDLAYPELRIAIEYDGEDHRDRWADDIVRQNRIIGAGWTLMRYTKGDLFGRPSGVVAQVRSARNVSLVA